MRTLQTTIRTWKATAEALFLPSPRRKVSAELWKGASGPATLVPILIRLHQLLWSKFNYLLSGMDCGHPDVLVVFNVHDELPKSFPKLYATVPI